MIDNDCVATHWVENTQGMYPPGWGCLATGGRCEPCGKCDKRREEYERHLKIRELMDTDQPIPITLLL